MISRKLKPTARRLAEAGLVALLLDLPQDCAVDRSRRRRAVGLPVAGLEGALDDGLAVERLASLLEHLRRPHGEEGMRVLLW